jgi:hypothetical protein
LGPFFRYADGEDAGMDVYLARLAELRNITGIKK